MRQRPPTGWLTSCRRQDRELQGQDRRLQRRLPPALAWHFRLLSQPQICNRKQRSAPLQMRRPVLPALLLLTPNQPLQSQWERQWQLQRPPGFQAYHRSWRQITPQEKFVFISRKVLQRQRQQPLCRDWLYQPVSVNFFWAHYCTALLGQ
mmetsp:Transcript_13662/g.38702  ORF Transcript_13662/g.38702 Transcript_13662/m.38702 type:complete len:150 (-) Transcript_13662:69-518(-)